MKCHLCDNYIVIKTDPGNLDYEIVKGARRQEGRWDPKENGQIVPDEKETQRRLFDDPMFKLEHAASDLKKSDDAKPAIFKLYERNHYVWDDDYTANSKLRAEFRNKKKELKVEADKDKALLLKSSLDIELLPENDQDTRLAAMMKLHSERVISEKDRKNEVINRPALPAIKAISSMRSQRLLHSKLSKNDLGIKRKTNDNCESLVKKSKPTETVTRSEQNSSSALSSETIQEKESTDITKVSSSLSLVCNYSGNSSSDSEN